MFYKVKDEEFPVKPDGKYRTPLEALTAAIKLAKEFAYREPVDVFKVDETGVHVAYQVDVQPAPKRRSREEGWNLWEQ